jgi:hypothetical protein
MIKHESLSSLSLPCQVACNWRKVITCFEYLGDMHGHMLQSLINKYSLYYDVMDNLI